MFVCMMAVLTIPLVKKNQTGRTKQQPASVEPKTCNKSYKKHQCKKRPTLHNPNPEREASPCMCVYIQKQINANNHIVTIYVVV